MDAPFRRGRRLTVQSAGVYLFVHPGLIQMLIHHTVRRRCDGSVCQRPG